MLGFLVCLLEPRRMAQISEKAKKAITMKPNRTFRFAFPRNIANMFRMNQGSPKEIPANDNEAIESAINNTSKFDVDGHLFFAELEGHDGKAVVLPSLLCGWLKEDTVVRAETAKSFKYATRSSHNTHDVDFRKQSLFYLETRERKFLEGMTSHSYRSFDGADICISAEENDLILDAMKKDGRLMNVERFRLTYEEDRRSIDLRAPANMYQNQVFKVSVMKLEHDSEKGPTHKQAVSGNLSVKDDYDVTVLYTFPATLSDPLTEEMRKRMVEDVQNRAYSTLLDEKSRNQADKEKTQAISRLAKREFAKKLPLKRPTRLLPKWNKYRKSIGCVFYGSHPQGTCFLIAKNMVITNSHVVMQIKQARESDNADQKINVVFDYLFPRHDEKSEAVPVEVDETGIFQGNFQFDYAILPLNEHLTLEKRHPLSLEVRSKLPQNGLVTIMGHPDGGEQVNGLC